MAEIVQSIEAARGCGYRKPGKSGVGIYLVGPFVGRPCGRIPFPLEACPCCGGGIKPARSFTWIEPRVIFAPTIEPRCQAAARMGDQGAMVCSTCPLGGAIPPGRHGLIWIGEKFYKTPQDFQREAGLMGISRKVVAVPRSFVLGETAVYLGHRQAAFHGWACETHGSADPAAALAAERCCEKAHARMRPGIFTVFMPTGIDLVVDDLSDIPERATRLAERIDQEGAAGAVRIVQVTPEQQEDFPPPQPQDTHAD